ncbi:hypothetical protein CK203_091319 [Vitis vinifera]|uniref:Uncharacterized protein n=1 Tax=Vitis vinifera TaxID=29760 RepID=A0A438CLH5_VITVI|nr:hypothetical protein CK203_091319 [Vitis vinifera]
MSKAKVVSSTLANHFKLSSRHNPSIDKEKGRHEKSSVCLSSRKFDVCHDMVEDVDNRKSTSGYLMTFSGGDVS